MGRGISPAFIFILLMGIVSLFADMAHEGARSVLGDYLGLLGASAATVGLVAGLGECLGYALRMFTGILADRTHLYWPMTIGGYCVNMLAIPSWPWYPRAAGRQQRGSSSRNASARPSASRPRTRCCPLPPAGKVWADRSPSRSSLIRWGPFWGLCCYSSS